VFVVWGLTLGPVSATLHALYCKENHRTFHRERDGKTIRCITKAKGELDAWSEKDY